MSLDWSARVEAAEAALRACELCPRRCRANRLAGSEGAFCGLDREAWVYKELLHLGEEQPVSPSHVVDLGGCSLRCLFCSEGVHASEPRHPPAVRLDPQWFVVAALRRRQQGARTLSFVGGDPTPSLPAILRCLALLPDEARLPVVWNCNGWTGRDTRALLAGVVSCWNVDLKVGAEACARRLAGSAPQGYRSAVEETLAAVAGDDLVPGLPRVLVRHLVMPGHVECCTLPVLHWLAESHPKAAVNLMTVFLPFGPRRPEAPEISRLLLPAERERAASSARATIGRLLIDGHWVRELGGG
jgi:putative pyruvate formate lyase activating enzyme